MNIIAKARELTEIIPDRTLGEILPQHPVELQWYLSRVRKLNPKIIVEIGSRHAGSLWMHAHAAPEAELVAIDLPESKWGHKGSLGNLNRVAARLRESGRCVDIIARHSRDPETILELREILGGWRIDLLFIDADHRFPQVRDDFLAYRSLMRDGGIVALHDIACRQSTRSLRKLQVWRLWNDLASEYPTESMIRYTGIGIVHLKPFDKGFRWEGADEDFSIGQSDSKVATCGQAGAITA